jgi:hypothetical protein
MGFVLPERKRPSYWKLARSLGRGMVYSTFLSGFAVALAGGAFMPTLVRWIVTLGLAATGAGFFGRRILADRTGYEMPVWLVAIWAFVGYIATPWGSAWLVREILIGTFGGEEMRTGPEPGTQPAMQPLQFQTGLAYEAALPEPVAAPPFLEPETQPEALPALRIVAPAAPEPQVAVVEAAPPIAEPVPVAVEPAPAPPPPVMPQPEPVAALVADPDPVPLAAPEAPAEPPQIPIVVVARTPELPPLEAEDEPFFLPHTELEPAVAHDPFATFWLDPAAPSPDGLTPGYLPPLTRMWSTPTGDKL